MLCLMCSQHADPSYLPSAHRGPDLAGVEAALAALRRTAGIVAEWQPPAETDDTDDSVALTLVREGGRWPLRATWQGTVRSGSALGVLRARLGDGVLVTTYLSPHLAAQSRELGLRFIDLAGNAYLDGPGLYVFVSGQRPADVTVGTMQGSGNPTALRMIFALLCQPALLQAPYREIARVSGIALGSVGTVLGDLTQRGWLAEDAGQRRRLTAPDRLLDEWVAGYPVILRPRLQARRFAAPDPDCWRNVSADGLAGMAWGGEVAAAAMTGALRPQTQTLYAAPAAMAAGLRHLLQTQRLRPQPDGPVEILEAFWSPATSAVAPPGLAPAVVVYADLMASLSARNLEVAAQLREGELRRVLDQF
jgi:hypothetical protein